MNKSALNRTLQRPLLNGSMYNALFSTSKCTPFDLGDGDTKLTINKVKDWVLETQSQLNTTKVQQLFSKLTLLVTVNNNKGCIYNHF